MTTTPVYATREDLRTAYPHADLTRLNTAIDRALQSGSRAVDALCHRRFYPELDTRYWNFPGPQVRPSWVLNLDANELISVTTLTAGGTTISDYYLEPQRYGPPYDRIEIDLSSSSAFTNDGTHQEAIAVTGLFGYDNRTVTAGALAEALDASETGMDVTDGSLVGVGDLLTIDSERMLVTGKTVLDSGDTLQSDLTNQTSSDTVAVSDGTNFHEGERILVGSEKMDIETIAGNNLAVTRAVLGSTIAAHSSSDTIYVYRTLTVERNAVGTTAATHTISTAITRQQYPGLVHELALAEAIVTLNQEGAGFAMVAGAGENAREVIGRGIGDLRDRCYRAHARKARARVI